MLGQQAEAEFSRVVEIDRIGENGLRLEVEATPEERRRLVERLGVLAVDLLAAEVFLQRGRDGSVRLRVQWHADVLQSCVVTLDPVASRLEDGFELLYVSDTAEDREAQREVQVDAEEQDPPEPLIGGRIDVGEAVVQYLAVALDPYPRRPGAELPREYGGEAGERVNPFQALRRLKARE